MQLHHYICFQATNRTYQWTSLALLQERIHLNRRALEYRHWWITQKKAYDIQNMTKVCNHGDTLPTLWDNLSIPSSRVKEFKRTEHNRSWVTQSGCLTLSLPMSYICGAPCKARNVNGVDIWTYVWHCWKPALSICCTMFQHWINAGSYPVAQLCVDILPATKVTLITDWI
jgi:hypothetical protein